MGGCVTVKQTDVLTGQTDVIAITRQTDVISITGQTDVISFTGQTDQLIAMASVCLRHKIHHYRFGRDYASARPWSSVCARTPLSTRLRPDPDTRRLGGADGDGFSDPG